MNKNVIHKAGGLYNIGMQRLISVDSYGDTFVIPEGVKYIGECAQTMKYWILKSQYTTKHN